jgi:hypothetical protein
MEPTGRGPTPRRQAGAIAPRTVLLAALLALAAIGAFVWMRVGPDGCAGPSSRRPEGVGFEERAVQAGITFRTTYLAGEQGENFKINLYDHGSGVAVGDYDADGLDDLYFVNQLGANRLYRNVGGGQFEDATERAGNLALSDRICVSAVWADYDNDGRRDLYVTSTRGGNVLFHNDGSGRFRDVTGVSGAGVVAHSQSATFFDADGDADLDLLVSNTAKWTLEDLHPDGRYYLGPADLFALVMSPHEKNVFLVNQGDGTFRDATEASGLVGTGWSGDTAVFDYDEDGDVDVCVANMFGRSHLYENDGRGVFTDVAERVLPRISWGTVGCKAFDYDDDGHLDLFLVDMHSDMWMNWTEFMPDPQTSKLKYPSFFGALPEANRTKWGPEFLERLQADPERVVFGSTLWHGLGGGRFEEVSDKAGVETLWPWGIATGDFDGDGREDAFVPSGMGYPYPYIPSPLLMNQDGRTFVDQAAAAGLEPLPGGPLLPGKFRGRTISRSSRAAATADFDADGRMDLVVSNFNDRALLYMNRWKPRPWVGFRLRGTRSNRDAIGAVVRLHVGGRVLTRQVHAAGGYLAQSSLTLHFGLGSAERVDRAEVTWPDGRKQDLGQVTLGKVHGVEEPL